MKTKSIEEATLEQPTHIMDDILKKNDKFETIRVLMEILCKELEISVESKPKDIFEAIHKVSVDYYKAMDDFKELRNSNQGRGLKKELDTRQKTWENGKK